MCVRSYFTVNESQINASAAAAAQFSHHHHHNTKQYYLAIPYGLEVGRSAKIYHQIDQVNSLASTPRNIHQRYNALVFFRFVITTYSCFHSSSFFFVCCSHLVHPFISYIDASKEKKMKKKLCEHHLLYGKIYQKKNERRNNT